MTRVDQLCQQAFDKLKRLTTVPVLACPDFSVDFQLKTDPQDLAWVPYDPRPTRVVVPNQSSSQAAPFRWQRTTTVSVSWRHLLLHGQ